MTCLASLPYIDTRIRDVVDDAVELVVLGVELASLDVDSGLGWL